MSQQLLWQASHDALTGLVNRREFERRLAELIDTAKSGREHALIYMDLDRFKAVNDTCGHAAGDELLRLVSRRLSERLRNADTIARMGGDEFVVLLDGVTGPDNAALVAQSLIDQFKLPFVLSGGHEVYALTRSGNRAPLAPRHLGNLWTSKQFTNGLGLAAGLRFVSDQFISEDNRFSIDSYVTVDAAVSYRVGRFRAAVNLKNLTGTEYETRGFGNVSAIPARPFEVVGRVELGFGAR